MNKIKEISIGIFVGILLYAMYKITIIFTIVILCSMIIFISWFIREGLSSRTYKYKNALQILTFEEIGGLLHAKKELMESIDFLKHSLLTEKYGIRPIKGILLEGPPGTGKTQLAKASANYTDSVFIAVSGSEFIEMYVGVGARRIRDLFNEATKTCKILGKNSAIIFIDELDVLGSKRGGSDNREYDQTLNQLLIEMDGIFTLSNPKLLIIAATNRKDMIDDALLRPGRFDRQIYVDLPNKKERQEILEIHSRNKPIGKDFSFNSIAEHTFGFSGAQLENVMNESAIYAMRELTNEIGMLHIQNAVDKVLLGETNEKCLNEGDRIRIGHHELGHSIMSELLYPGSVSVISLSARGNSLGYVRHQINDGTHLETKQSLENNIMICLAGAAAEILYYENFSTGSKLDFEQANILIDKLIDSGLSPLGIISLNSLPKDLYWTTSKNILDNLMDQTREKLDNHREQFTQLLPVLLKEEVLYASMLQEFIKVS